MRIARAQTKGEEIANSIVHGLGLALSVAALVALVVKASHLDRAMPVVASAVFGATMVALYLASTIYHALPPGPSKSLFRVIDHSAIYLLIAGTYTPFALGPLRGPWGWSLLGVVWALAALGIITKVKLGFVYPRLSTGLYVAMGWMGIVVLKPLLNAMPAGGLWWLLAGGICYTGGVLFFVKDAQLKFGHALWHVCVVAGTLCHFVAVSRYAIS
jgi:hemolysin III